MIALKICRKFKTTKFAGKFKEFKIEETEKKKKLKCDLKFGVPWLPVEIHVFDLERPLKHFEKF